MNCLKYDEGIKTRLRNKMGIKQMISLNKMRNKLKMKSSMYEMLLKTRLRKKMGIKQMISLKKMRNENQKMNGSEYEVEARGWGSSIQGEEQAESGDNDKF